MPRLPLLCLAAATLAAADALPPTPNAGGQGNPYQRWELGPNRAKDYFPLAVWMQNPANAPRYQAAGINLFIGLWKGPTEEQLATLKKHNMPVICHQNEVGLAHKDDPLIVAWMHGDEPDIAHDFKGHWGGDIERVKAAWPDEPYFKRFGPNKPFTEKWGPPIPPTWIQRDAAEIRAKDPRRPIFLNLGHGVAWEKWVGRGTRSGKDEDFPEYLKGCDIASFDIYPGASKEIAGQLWRVPQGVTNLRTWSQDRAVVWNCVEAGFGTPEHTATPRQVRAEVWMSLIHGSMGIVYFVHRFGAKPTDRALLDDPAMLAEVTRTNKQIQALAPLLNSPSVVPGATPTTDKPEIPVAAMTKVDGATMHVWAVAMRPGTTTATFTVPGMTSGTVTVVGENRTIPLAGGRFSDAFADWDVHLYEIRP